jgi:NAD(P)-dependent dehydrogenase (short-subunit alcohol dehydrogenase family)
MRTKNISKHDGFNFFGAVYLSQALIPLLRQCSEKNSEKSKLINISLIGWVIGLPWDGFYYASKFALLGISESLKFELNNQNIVVSVIMPGGIQTPFYEKTDKAVFKAIELMPKDGK